MTIGRSPQLYCRCRCSVALYCSPSWCGALCSSILNFVQKWGFHILTDVQLLKSNMNFAMTIGQCSQLYCWCRCTLCDALLFSKLVRRTLLKCFKFCSKMRFTYCDGCIKSSSYLIVHQSNFRFWMWRQCSQFLGALYCSPVGAAHCGRVF